MANIVERQFELATIIEQQHRNFCKDGADRKDNVGYYKTRTEILLKLWNEFQFNHDQLIMEQSRTDPYFTEKCFDTTKQVYEVYKKKLNDGYSKCLAGQKVGAVSLRPLEETEPSGNQSDKHGVRREPSPAPTTRNESIPRQSTGTNSRLDELLRQQKANFKAFTRTVANIQVDDLTEKWELEDALKTLEKRFAAIDSLHWTIDSDLGVNDYVYETEFNNHEQLYNKLKKEINKKIWSVSHREKSTPQLDIPIFTGNYNNWVSFKDLFSEAIHHNPSLSSAQKMQFLKGKVRGEAERLIQHLQISADNYHVCWDILNNRYNNKNLIFNSHMNNLFSLPNIQSQSLNQIKRMHDVTIECLHAVKNLGINIDTWDPIIIYILSQKLDSETYGQYIESLQNSRDLPVLQHFLHYLESKFTTLETSRRKQDGATYKYNNQQSSSGYKKPNYNTLNKNKYSYNQQQNNGQTQIAKSFHASNIKCPLCKNDHGIYNCKFFLQMQLDKKMFTINRLGLCKNCLFSHNGSPCNSNKTCRKCFEQHSTLIHDAFVNSNGNKPLTSSSTNTDNNKNVSKTYTNNTSHVSQDEPSEILLATAELKVFAANGQQYKLRALIDQGSQISLITEHAAQLLGIKREQCKGVIYGVGQRENNCKGKINITCTSMYSNYTFNTEAIIMNNLIKSLPNNTFPKPSWTFIENINLADPQFNISRPVDILLGAEVYSKIMLSGIIRGEDSTQPMAQQTQLGWLLCGSARTFNCNVIINNLNDIQQFWEAEEITEDCDLSTEDIHCLKYFEETTTRRQDGRYEVRLPMKPNYEEKLGTSKPTALAQFRHLEKQFQRKENLAKEYKTFMKEYEDLQHMKLATSSCYSAAEYFLPHHAVYREESATTKCRVVYNGSSKTSTGYSLNDLMYTGPNLQQDLQSLLLKWRQFEFAFTADIEKMYRQILIHEAHQQLQKIVWRETPEQPIKMYQLSTITYGTKAAPFLAMMTLKKLASDERETFPEASRILENSFYMDDLLHGAHSIVEGRQLVEQLTELLTLGGFNLRKWASNNQEILNNINCEQNNINNIFHIKAESTSKTLGLSWNAGTDQFTFHYNPTKQTSLLTKRTLLSEISKLYDPLGWLAPLTTKLKCLFQKVWQTNTKWDEQLSADIQREWSKLQADIHIINDIEIPRWIQCKQSDVIELHGFCDASTLAYACVVYARIKRTNAVVLIAAKSKLVPRKKVITLPRLELCGAHLLSKLIDKIKQTLNQHDIEMYGWIDSQVALGWLQGEPNRWKPFVANRVEKITRVVPKHLWHYVKSSDNPADPASRGLNAPQLKEHPLWWHGPAWLTSFTYDNLPEQQFETKQDLKIKQVNTTQVQNESIIHLLLKTHSSLTKTIRIVAWILRALTRERAQHPSYLTLHELRKAKLLIVKHVQMDEFGTEIKQLHKQGRVQSQSILANLNPFLDKEGILRVGGRLAQANISDEMKHPKIIPRDCRLAALLVELAHLLTFHGGPRVTMAALRQEYWICGGNNYVKKVLRNCVTCRKHEGRTQQQLMGDLPAARSNPAQPFYNTGVDYTGFVEVKINKGRGVKTTKGYIALFVCMATKCVHLELVSDLTSSAFLAALRRMAARRGAPRHLYSDNGTNFVGANRILQQEQEQLETVFNNSFLTEVAEMNIEWHFNAPAWPSAGGIWERAVRSLKFHLKRVVGEQKLTYEEYSTILSQLEACLNSRPLCALTEDIEDLNFLTPAHFLTGRAETTIIETSEDARSRWYLTQKLFEDIWKRWKTEYLSQLTARQKWTKPMINMKIGDMVVIHEDNLPSGKWALGRVIATHPGEDGYVRVVTLKTRNGIMKRPIIKLSILPLESKTNAEQDTNTSQQETRREPVKTRISNRTFSATAMMIVYFMAILTTGQSLKTTTIDESQGLYFDKITNMQLVRDEWTLITYYDMNPYRKSILSYKKYYKNLQALCQPLETVNHCDVILTQLQHSYMEIEHRNNILLSHQHNTQSKRKRRGLINGVGYVANSLFGVLDSRFAEQYERDIALIRRNQEHMALLWKNQTSVVEAEYNLLKRMEDAMQQQHKMINSCMDRLKTATNGFQKELDKVEATTEFTLAAMAANNLLTYLKYVQDTLLDTITNIYNNRINIHLIDPQQLQTQLHIILGQLKQDLTLPFYTGRTNIQTIYQLLRIRTRITERNLIFEIKIPLIGRDAYDLYTIVPVPRRVGGNMRTIIPIEKYIAVNLQKDSYLPLSERDLEHCMTRDSTVILCKLKTAIYKLKSDKDFCVKDQHKNTCKTSISTCQNKLINLTRLNYYFYFCCGLCQLRTLCRDQVTTHDLTAANIITIEEDCVIKSSNFTIYSHKRQNSKMNLRSEIPILDIAPINSVINLTSPEHLGGNNMSTSISNSLEEQEILLKKIDKRVKELKQAEPLSESISVHDVHHYTLIYSTWGLITVIILVLACQRRLGAAARAARVARAAQPPPAPGAQAPADGRAQPARAQESVNHVKVRECSENVPNTSFVDMGTSPVLKKVVFGDSDK